MALVAAVHRERRLPFDLSQLDRNDDLLSVVSTPRSDIPAVTHVDYSARVQTLRERDHPDLYAVLNSFHRRTDCAVLVNTSFNVRGEPIVCSPLDAYRCFMRTKIDLLVLEDCLLWKDQQPKMPAVESGKQELGRTNHSAEETETLLRSFFAERLVPAAQCLRERHVTFFATGPDPAAESYFERHQTAPYFTTIEPEDCIPRLVQMWQEEGLHELAELAEPLAELVLLLAPKDDDSGELSPLIYVMF